MIWGLLLCLQTGGIAADGWEEAGRAGGVTVFMRQKAGDAGVHETLAVGVIDAPPWVVKNAIDDVDAKIGRMPYLHEARVLKRDARGVLVYNRTSAPVVTDRDYTILMYDDSYVRSDGSVVWVTRFRTANDEGPPVRSGVVRVKETYGEWRFEPLSGGTMTRAFYFVFAEPGGVVPSALAEWGSKEMMSGIFDALRVRSKDPAYRKSEPQHPSRKSEAHALGSDFGK